MVQVPRNNGTRVVKELSHLAFCSTTSCSKYYFATIYDTRSLLLACHCIRMKVTDTERP